MTQTLLIIGTDWEGDRPEFIKHPFTDGGRLQLDRRRLEDWANLWDETGRIARVDAVAVGIRGANDVPAVACLPLARETWDAAPQQPALLPWFDTGGLPDNTPGQVPFDFANDAHIELGWERFARIFFDAFGTATLARSKNGRVLCEWWGIATDTGHGFLNQHLAHRLLSRVDVELTTRGLGPADHIVDKTWSQHAPDLRVHAVHDWFEASLGQFRSVRTHNGITTGVVVPSFAWPGASTYLCKPVGGTTLAQGLAACVTAGCDYILIEGHTDLIEGAEVTRTARPDGTADDSKLLALRAHMDAMNPEPIERPGGLMQYAVSNLPVLTYATQTLVLGVADKRFACRWNMATGGPDPTSNLYLCLNPDGKVEAKPNIGEWESSQPVEAGDHEIRWRTVNAEKTQSAVLVLALQQFVE